MQRIRVSCTLCNTYNAYTRRVHPLHIPYSPNLCDISATITRPRTRFRDIAFVMRGGGGGGEWSRKIRLFPRVSFFLFASTASDERRERINGAVENFHNKGNSRQFFLSSSAFQRRKSRNSTFFVLRTCEHILPINLFYIRISLRYFVLPLAV